jgi:Chaperone of endosialidase
MNAPIQLRTTIPPLLLPLLLACFGLLPRAQATDLDSVLPNGNTADGSGVLVSLTSGVWNSGFGFQVLNHDTAGKSNTATGVRALFSDTSGSNNTANGVYALYGNTNGWYNNAVGAYALSNNIIGHFNTANGYAALYRNDADGNTATGYGALYNNTTGVQNTAFGLSALASNTTAGANGSGANTGVGAFALFVNATGGANTAIGYAALGSSTGGNNIALGDIAGFDLTTGNDNIDIGNRGAAADDSTIRIGTLGTQTATYIAGIGGATVAGGVPVIIDAGGHLGTIVSSARFKDEIKSMDKASEALLALKPVTFRYKQELDPERIPQFGLVAEEVEKVNPDLVARDAKGEVYTVRYEAVNAMLLNEFLKEHRKVQELEAIVDRQQKSFQSKLAEQDKQIEALASAVEKVSDRLEMSKPAPQVVVNKP